MKLFHAATPAPELRHPQHCEMPTLVESEVAALYRAARIGGDFFDFYKVRERKLVFMLLDIAGKRDRALHIAAHAQELFHAMAARLYSNDSAEDSEVVTELTLELNRAVLSAAGGICHTPAFVGAYDEEIGTICYINAGHVSGILKDDQGILMLEANGLPLGLFSHATHDSQFCGFFPGASLTLFSRGVIEARSGKEEFGLERVRSVVASGQFSSAESICAAVLSAVEEHAKKPTHFGPSLSIPGLSAYEPNDTTVIALLRR